MIVPIIYKLQTFEIFHGYRTWHIDILLVILI